MRVLFGAEAICAMGTDAIICIHNTYKGKVIMRKFILILTAALAIGFMAACTTAEEPRPSVTELAQAIDLHYKMYQPSGEYPEDARRCLAGELGKSDLKDETLQAYVNYMQKAKGIGIEDPKIDPILEGWINATGETEYDKLLGQAMPWDPTMAEFNPSDCSLELVTVMENAGKGTVG